MKTFSGLMSMCTRLLSWRCFTPCQQQVISPDKNHRTRISYPVTKTSFTPCQQQVKSPNKNHRTRISYPKDKNKFHPLTTVKHFTPDNNDKFHYWQLKDCNKNHQTNITSLTTLQIQDTPADKYEKLESMLTSTDHPCDNKNRSMREGRWLWF